MLEQIFYIVGTTYFTISLLILTALVIAVFVITQKLKQLKQELPQKASTAIAASNFIKNSRFGKYLPFLAVIPVILKAFHEFKSRKSS